jgi:hypothetical protein
MEYKTDGCVLKHTDFPLQRTIKEMSVIVRSDALVDWMSYSMMLSVERERTKSSAV